MIPASFVVVKTKLAVCDRFWLVTFNSELQVVQKHVCGLSCGETLEKMAAYVDGDCLWVLEFLSNVYFLFPCSILIEVFMMNTYHLYNG